MNKKILVFALLIGSLAARLEAQVKTFGTVKTIGTVQTLSNGTSNSSIAHGIYVAFPSLSTACPNSNRWCTYTVNLFNGTASISSSVKGAAVESHWGGTGTTGISETAPSGTINTSGNYPSYTYTDPDRRLDDVYTCAGTCAVHKQVGFLVESTNYADALAGNMNVGIPTWYSATQAITAISRASGIIHVSVTGPINFLTGLVVGSTPANGCILGTSPAPDGVTKCIQIVGQTGHSDLNGVWPICDHTVSNTAGCTDPTSTDLYLISAGSNETGTATGTIGNPIIDLVAPSGGTADLCSEGGVFVAWNTNYIDAYKDFLTHFMTRYGPSTVTEQALGSAYFRFGFAYAGFENFPSANNGPTATYSAGVPTNCRGVLNTSGYGGGAAFTSLTFGNGGSDPSGLNTGEPANCATPGATGGCVFWNNTYLLPWFQWMAANLKPLTTKYLSIGLSLTTYGSPDKTAPILMASNALQNGIGLGSAGLQHADLAFNGLSQTYNNNADYIFNLHRGFGFNFQTSQSSDPTGTLVQPGTNTQATTGPLTNLLPFGATQGGQQLEPIIVDAECTESGFDGSVYGIEGPTHAASASGTGSVVTITQTTGTLSADFQIGTYVTVAGMSIGGYNVTGAVITGITSNSFTFAGTTSGAGTGGTFANDYENYNNCLAAGYPTLFPAVGALIN